jgi:hypothetical protein
MPGTLSPLPSVRTARSMRREGAVVASRCSSDVSGRWQQQGGFGEVTLVGKAFPTEARRIP